jgi:hypothetical protein
MMTHGLTNFKISNLFLIDNASVTAAVFGDMVPNSPFIITKGPFTPLHLLHF